MIGYNGDTTHLMEHLMTIFNTPTNPNRTQLQRMQLEQKPT
jgi:hypothetical protein